MLICWSYDTTQCATDASWSSYCFDSNCAFINICGWAKQHFVLQTSLWGSGLLHLKVYNYWHICMHAHKWMSLVTNNLFNCTCVTACKDGKHSDNNNANVVVGLPLVIVKWYSCWWLHWWNDTILGRVHTCNFTRHAYRSRTGCIGLPVYTLRRVRPVHSDHIGRCSQWTRTVRVGLALQCECSSGRVGYASDAPSTHVCILTDFFPHH